jgi:broad specificity phosphatase PhoE
MSQPTLYFIRHGETDWNAVSRLQGQRDIPLNALGRKQATHCGDTLRERLARDRRSPDEFDFIASPLSRARETMEWVRSGVGADPTAYRTDPRLVELSFGDWEGFTYAELRRQDAGPRMLAERERDKWNFVPPGGESYAELLVRIRAWYATVTNDAVVVSHGGVARTLFVLFGLLQPALAPVHDVDQGAIYELAPGRMSKYT